MPNIFHFWQPTEKCGSSYFQTFVAFKQNSYFQVTLMSQRLQESQSFWKSVSVAVGCHKEPNFWQAWYQLSQSILSSTKIVTFTQGWSPISFRRYSLGLWHCFYKPIAISKRFFHLNNKIYKNLYGWLWKSLKHKIIPAYRFADCFPFPWFPFLLPRFDTANARQRNVIKQPIKIVRLLASLRRHYFRKN